MSKEVRVEFVHSLPVVASGSSMRFERRAVASKGRSLREAIAEDAAKIAANLGAPKAVVRVDVSRTDYEIVAKLDAATGVRALHLEVDFEVLVPDLASAATVLVEEDGE